MKPAEFLLGVVHTKVREAGPGAMGLGVGPAVTVLRTADLSGLWRWTLARRSVDVSGSRSTYRSCGGDVARA